MRITTSAILLLGVLLSTSVGAQTPLMSNDPEFELNRWLSIRTGFQANAAPGTPVGYGVGGVVEPMFLATENLAVGLRVDAAALFAIDVGPGAASAGIGVPVSTLLKVEYGLGSSIIRPVVGAGGGTYLLTRVGGSGGPSGAGAGMAVGRYFGLAPQLGLDFGGFRMAAMYHFIFTPQNTGGSYGALELSWRVF